MEGFDYIWNIIPNTFDKLKDGLSVCGDILCTATSAGYSKFKENRLQKRMDEIRERRYIRCPICKHRMYADITHDTISFICNLEEGSCGIQIDQQRIPDITITEELLRMAYSNMAKEVAFANKQQDIAGSLDIAMADAKRFLYDLETMTEKEPNLDMEHEINGYVHRVIMQLETIKTAVLCSVKDSETNKKSV